MQISPEKETFGYQTTQNVSERSSARVAVL